jgi:isochorismate synthase
MTIQLVTRPLSEFTDAEVDLNDLAGSDGLLFVRNGVGFAGLGELARVPLTESEELLAGLIFDSTVDAPGTSGVTIGWHPFSGNDGVAVLPAITVGKSPQQPPWVTFPRGDESTVRAALDSIPPIHVGTASYSIRAGVPVPRYLEAVAKARDAARRGDIVKAVIARDIIVESSEAIDVRTLLKRLKASFGSSYRYSIDGLVGASPELLVEKINDQVRSHPLAGTCPRTGDPETDNALAAELRASSKNQLEHRVVIDMVHDTLLPWCSFLDWQPEPEIVAVANVQHLGTRVEGTLSQPLPSVIDLVRALSPTPALGGHPRAAALNLIAEYEGMDRGRYGGAVGWTDRDGNGTWAVTIRCAELSPDRRSARLFAGGGIVADSDPLSELAETQTKLQAMLAAIVRP